MKETNLNLPTPMPTPTYLILENAPHNMNIWVGSKQTSWTW